MVSDTFSFGGATPLDAQPFDFSYAEQLFAHPGRISTPSHAFVSLPPLKAIGLSLGIVAVR